MCLKGSYDWISSCPFSLECYKLIVHRYDPWSLKTKEIFFIKLRLDHAFLKRLIQTRPHMSTSRCGEICITPPKCIRNERRRSYSGCSIVAAMSWDAVFRCERETLCLASKRGLNWKSVDKLYLQHCSRTVQPYIGECAAQLTEDCVLNQGKSSLQCEHWMAVDTIKWGNSNVTRTVCKYVSIFKELANVYSNASFEHCRVTFVVCRFSDHKCRHSNVSTARYNAQ